LILNRLVIYVSPSPFLGNSKSTGNLSAHKSDVGFLQDTGKYKRRV